MQQLFDNTTPHRDALTAAATNLATNRHDLLINSQNEDSAFLAVTRWTNLGLAAFSFALAILLAVLVTRRFARPVNQLIGKLRLVADGDLTQQFEMQGSDEIAELSAIFNRTVASLRQTIARIHSQANAVAVTSQLIAGSSIKQATSLSEQAIAVSQVSTTVEE